uniref:Cyclin-dependent kinase 2 homolog n=1 Tax=Noctiluca scintillans TaxID=2966 RepID=A0A7S1FCH7_NOCSC|mmetsp:Transcript_52581/g.140105  ORF Transcript_52581/g.140105 Transcript_52581/m.140105 type:complete len:405 (+) Transcript_52581:108-1322(+)
MGVEHLPGVKALRPRPSGLLTPPPALEVDCRTTCDDGAEVGKRQKSTEGVVGVSAALLGGCRKEDCFRKLNRIAEGTYGVVYRACDLQTGEVVALKQLKLDAAKATEDGFPILLLREISILMQMDHPNIVRCREVVVGTRQHVFMVMDYAEHELKMLLDRHRFAIAEVKCLLAQLLAAVEFLHERWVVHRDLKTSNIVLTNKGVLKLCDFGLARYYGEPKKPYTQRVVSLWYRAPELLMGQEVYTTCVDVWSVGCVFAEMLLGRPVFEGKAELHQLCLIYELVGVPTEETWPGYNSLPNRKLFEFKLSLPRWQTTFPDVISDVGLELLKSLLECCPARRVSAATACHDPYFMEFPHPQDPNLLPTFQESNNEGRARPRIGPVRVIRRDSRNQLASLVSHSANLR